MQKKRVVVVGGGFGGLFTSLDLANHADVTLVSDEDHFLFKPMLYELFSGEVEAWQVAPYYGELLDDSVRFVQGAVSNIDFENQSVSVLTREAPLSYDALLLSAGGVTNYWGIPGAEEFSLPFRKAADAYALRSRMVAALDRVPPDAAPQNVRQALTFVVVGAGASGVELSTKMADLLKDAFVRRALKGQPRVLVVEMGDRVVPGMGDEMRTYVENALRDSVVEVYTNTAVKEVMADGVRIEHDGISERIQTAAVVWTAGVRASPLIEKLNLEKNKRGLVLVKPTLQSEHHSDVFVIGDAAFFPDAAPTLAGTAQLAYQQARLAADNIRAYLNGGELRTRHFEELGEALSLGTENAAIMAGNKTFGGPLARQARFALYTGRLPTWHHRLKVGASWFLGGKAPRPLQPLGF